MESRLFDNRVNSFIKEWSESLEQLGKSGGILGFDIGGPSCVRIQESNANLVDRMQFG